MNNYMRVHDASSGTAAGGLPGTAPGPRLPRRTGARGRDRGRAAEVAGRRRHVGPACLSPPAGGQAPGLPEVHDTRLGRSGARRSATSTPTATDGRRRGDARGLRLRLEDEATPAGNQEWWGYRHDERNTGTLRRRHPAAGSAARGAPRSQGARAETSWRRATTGTRAAPIATRSRSGCAAEAAIRRPCSRCPAGARRRSRFPRMRAASAWSPSTKRATAARRSTCASPGAGTGIRPLVPQGVAQRRCGVDRRHGRSDRRAHAAIRRRDRGDRLGRDRWAVRGRGAGPHRARRSRSTVTTTRSSPSRASSRATYEYEVALDGDARWPRVRRRASAQPIRTFDADGPFDISFGSCRVALPHEKPYTLHKDEHREGREFDALHVLAQEMRHEPARALAAPAADARRPGLRGRGRARDPRVHPLAARHRRARRARRSPTSRSTRASTGSRGASRWSAGCSRRCRRRW